MNRPARALSDRIWEFAGLPMREFKSSRLIAEILRGHGFKTKLGVADMPTAIEAAWGKGRPVIAIQGEYDALPTLSQKKVPYKDPIVEGAPGHGCGHNLYGASGVGGAIATKVAMEAAELKGTVKFLGTPAEEQGIGKVFMVRDGLYNGVDAVLGHHIGSAIARRAKGFDMKVIYNDVYRREDLEEGLGLTYRSREEVLREADFISIHVPLTPETHHLIGAEELEAMKVTAILVNTSRGPVVDEMALYEALRDGAITGAGLDVFETKPLDPWSPILGLDNIVLTPHLASGSVEIGTKMAVTAATNLVSVLQGNEPPNLVNPEVKKVRPLKAS